MLCTTEGACLERLITIAKPVLRQCDESNPRTGRGRRPEIPDWVVALLILTATLKKKKTKSAQFRWIRNNKESLMPFLNGHRIPSRSSYFDRFKKAHDLMSKAIIALGQKAIQNNWADPSVAAVDKSLMEAKGPKWWKSDRIKNRIPKKLSGVDKESEWGFSSHHGWVQGYSFEVVVSCGKKGVIFPLVGSVDVASLSEHRSFGPKIRHIPESTRCVVADAGYDNNDFAEQIELLGTGRSKRRFLCPQNKRSAKGKTISPKGKNESRKNYAIRIRRAERRAFFERDEAQKKFRLRSQCIEPFNEWFKSTFELNETVWHRGMENNRTQVLTCLFAYQVLVCMNCKNKQPSGRIRSILDAM